MCQGEIPRERWNFKLEGNIKGKCRMQLESSYLIEKKRIKKEWILNLKKEWIIK
jgi:hypothetical protein